MAPEQLEGKEADARTDIFALGATLYEMASGRKAFSATSQASLIGAILHTDPPAISTLQSMSPPALDRLVKTCLAKDPEERWQSAADIKRELRWISESSAADAAASPVARRRERHPLPWIVAGVLAIAAAVLAALLARRQTPPLPVIRSSILPPPGAELVPSQIHAGPVEISPDGTRVVFTARRGEGPNQLWVRALSDSEARPLAGTEGADRPFWSADGRSIGFFADRALKKVDANGGPVFRLAGANESRGGTWNKDGVILYTPFAWSPIDRIPAGGGQPVAATQFGEKDSTHRYPRFLPDGRHFLYLVRHSGAGAGENPEVRVGSLDSMESKVVVANVASNAIYASGYLLYVREGALVAQRFDLERLAAEGEPVVVAPDVLMDERFSRGTFTASDNGILAYQTGTGVTNSILRWVDREGRALGTVGEPAEYFSAGGFEVSPDGTKAAVSIVDLRTGDSDVWLVDLASGTRSRFTAGTGDKYAPTWSADGKRLAYASSKDRGYDIVVRSTDGAEAKIVLSEPLENQLPTGFSPDGRFLVIEKRQKRRDDMFLLDLNGNLESPPATVGPGVESLGQVSPNGRYLAYMSDESGRYDVYVTTFPTPGLRWQVSQNGGREPRWSKDGNELFFFAPDNRLVAAEVRTDTPSFEVGALHPLFQARQFGMAFRYDVSKDGKRFLVQSGLPQELSAITLVTNWTAELEKKK